MKLFYQTKIEPVSEAPNKLKQIFKLDSVDISQEKLLNF